MSDVGQDLARLLSYAEDGIYLVTAGLLTATAIVLLFTTGQSLIRSLRT